MPDESLLGCRLDEYYLHTVLGSGLYATVYRAARAGSEGEFVVKVFPGDLSPDRFFVPRLKREVLDLSRFEHPGIVPVLAAGEAEGRPYVVMPLLPGGSLRDRAREGVPALVAMDWLEALAAALDYAHGEGIVHRDVKPANVLFDKNGRLFLADFGLAREQGSAGLTVAGTVLGTPVYMSPEQVKGEPAGPRSDQYALGVLAYYLLAGTPPFEANSVFVVMEKTLREEPALPSDINPGLHRSADYVLLKVLEKRPEDRFESCREFVEALQRASRRGTDPGVKTRA